MPRTIRFVASDVHKLMRAAQLLEIYSRDREEYDIEESQEAKWLSDYVYKLSGKVLKLSLKK